MKTIYNRNMNGTPYFGIALLIPLLITGIGVWCSHYPPKTRQALFGYRSPLSMRSERNWMAAQKALGHLWSWLGLADLAVVFFVELALTASKNIVWMVYGSLGMVAAQVFVLVATYLIMERKLKKLDASNENT